VAGIFLHQLLWYLVLCTKNYEHLSIFVKVTAKNQWHLFYVDTVYTRQERNFSFVLAGFARTNPYTNCHMKFGILQEAQLSQKGRARLPAIDNFPK